MSGPTSDGMRDEAEAWLRRIAGDAARLHDEQWQAIAALLAGRSVVNVQRTGAGKSAVYWVTTALRRAAGAGPTLVVSPLLALMRDQVEAATRAGLVAATINSANADEWDGIEDRLRGGTVDVLLVSPERLNSVGFRSRVLPGLGARLGCLVVDEAHSLSDWGHDFRPDYLRLRQLIGELPVDTPVLFTTATANSRVVSDIAGQLDRPGAVTLRGPLDRPSLALSVVHPESTAHAYAWIADALDELAGSGIVYTLTVAETQRLAEFLRDRGHRVAAYSSDTPPDERTALERALLANEVKALVATSSLGMGFDKPDVGFVVHLGAPSSPIGYYQQVGRAGRALERAVGVLLPTAADERVWAYFDSTAMPAEPVVRRVLDVLATADGALSVPAIEAASDVRRGRLEMLLKILDVEGAVERVAGGYRRTDAPWRYDTDRYAAVAAARRAEQDVMRDYVAGRRCLMRLLREALDDPAAADCGRCSVCTGVLPPPGAEPAEETVRAAVRHLRGRTNVLEPRKMWPSGAARRGTIRADARAEPGRALAYADDPGWGEQVGAALSADRPVDDAVLDGLVRTLAGWGWPAGRPVAIAAVPSRRHAGLLGDLVGRLGAIGRLPAAEPLSLLDDGRWQDHAATGRAAADGALGRLRVAGAVPAGPLLLVDDYARSGWTLTVAAALLREAGASAVYPLVLHKRP